MTGYVLSLDLINHISNNYKTLKNYHNEDAAVGLWLKNLPYYHQVQFRKLEKKITHNLYSLCGLAKFSEAELEKYVENNSNHFSVIAYGQVDEVLLAGHRLEPNRLETCWEKIFKSRH